MKIIAGFFFLIFIIGFICTIKDEWGEECD